MHDVNNARTPRATGEMRKASKLWVAVAVVIAMVASLFVAGVTPVANATTYPVTSEDQLNEINKNLANYGNGGLRQPTQGTIGGEHNSHTNDVGVATWVGRNMYVGAPKDDVTKYGTKSDGTVSKIEESYAVEAEGLTLVNGKLAMNMVKGKYRVITPAENNSNTIFDNSWHRNGFRFGVVGFGGQVRPAQYSTVLSVGNNVQDNPLQLTDYNGNDVNVLGFGENGRGFVDGAQQYWIDVNGNCSTPIDSQWDFQNKTKESLYALKAEYNSNGVIIGNNPGYGANWDVQNQLGISNIFSQVRYGGGGAQSRDYSNFQTVITDTSEQLLKLDNTGTVHDDQDAPPTEEDPYVRQKYNYFDRSEVLSEVGDDTVKKTRADVNKYQLDMTFDETNKEKLIAFVGDGTSRTQVFTLDGSKLSSDGYNGVSFAFEKIPDNAAVVVNVTGEVPEFHMGWRFWWNGEDISNGYVNPPSNDDDKTQLSQQDIEKLEDLNEKYSRASEAIMWNFADATDLVIKGGQVKEGQAVWQAPHWKNNWRYNQDENKEGMYYFFDRAKTYGDGDQADENMQVHVEDDPAAAMLGSILVPNGDFESHITTNGRVWVGNDFMMYNPKGLKEYAVPSWDADNNKHGAGSWNFEDISASLVCMDQERHNFIWYADYTQSAGTIEWNKINASGEPVSGTKWGVYTSREDAKNKANALIEITDNGANDWSSTAGVLKTEGLVLNADYYVRELQEASGYTLNTNIYRIDTSQGVNSTQIVAVFDANGTLISDASKTELGTVKDSQPEAVGIVNRSLPAVEWEKNDSETGALLSGSAWRLYKKQVNADSSVTYPIIKESIADATNTMIYLDTKTAQWSALQGIESPQIKVSYRVDGEKQWGVKTMNLQGDGIYSTYIPSAGNQIWFSFFLGEEENKSAEYRPGAGTNKDHFVCPSTVAHITVRAKDWIEYAQPQAPGLESDYVDLDSRLGRFKIEGLSEGEYTLQETKVPNGYWLVGGENSRYYTFTVTLQDGQYQINWIASSITVNEQTIQTTQAPVVNGSSVGKISNAPTKVTWKKVDSTDEQVLAGSSWALKKGGTLLGIVSDCTSDSCGTGQYDDRDPAPGQFRLERLPVGTYTLQEESAPAGYELSETVYEFTITEIAPNPAEITVNGGKIGNTRKTGVVEWTKIAAGDSTGAKPLDDSVWQITFTPQGSTDKQSHTITDCTSDNACAVEDAWTSDRDGIAGKFRLEHLQWGTYELKETKAPDGYNLSDKTYTFTIDKDNLENIKIMVDGREVAGNLIENEPGVVLPMTGRGGLPLWTVLTGIALVLGVMLMAVRLRRQTLA